MKWGGAVLCILLLSCDKGPTQYGHSSDVYFQTGRVYRYAWSASLKDSAGNLLYVQTDTVTLAVVSATEKLDTMTNLIKVVVTSENGPSTVYYRNSVSALTEVAYDASGGGPLVQPSVKTTRGHTFAIPPSLAISTPAVVQWLQGQHEIVKPDSAIVRTDPRIVYRYPLITGQQWVSFTDPFGETREVTGFEDVEVPVGRQQCAVIRTYLSIGSDIDWLDYVNFDGLVKRSMKMKLTLVAAGDPGGTGETAEATEQAVLISTGYSLQ